MTGAVAVEESRMGEEIGSCELFGEGGLACWPPGSVRWGEGTHQIAPTEEPDASQADPGEEEVAGTDDERLTA